MRLDGGTTENRVRKALTQGKRHQGPPERTTTGEAVMAQLADSAHNGVGVGEDRYLSQGSGSCDAWTGSARKKEGRFPPPPPPA